MALPELAKKPNTTSAQQNRMQHIHKSSLRRIRNTVAVLVVGNGLSSVNGYARVAVFPVMGSIPFWKRNPREVRIAPEISDEVVVRSEFFPELSLGIQV